jgi:chromosome partitioning protein
MATIGITNQKGGCGKTVTAINLAAGLARAGFRTLVVDLDPQAPIAAGLGVKPPEEIPPIAEAIKRQQLGALTLATPTPGLFVAPGDVSLDHQALANEPLRDTLLARALAPIEGQFDYVLLDTPPSLDLVTLNAIMAADWLILPCDVDRESLVSLVRTLEVTFEYVRHRPEVEPEGFYEVLVTMYDHRDQVMNAWFEGQLAQLACPVFRTRVRRATAFKKARANSLPIFDYRERNRLSGPAARRGVEDFLSLTQEVIAHEAQRRDRRDHPPARQSG